MWWPTVANDKNGTLELYWISVRLVRGASRLRAALCLCRSAWDGNNNFTHRRRVSTTDRVSAIFDAMFGLNGVFTFIISWYQSLKSCWLQFSYQCVCDEFFLCCLQIDSVIETRFRTTRWIRWTTQITVNWARMGPESWLKMVRWIIIPPMDRIMLPPTSDTLIRSLALYSFSSTNGSVSSSIGSSGRFVFAPTHHRHVNLFSFHHRWKNPNYKLELHCYKVKEKAKKMWKMTSYDESRCLNIVCDKKELNTIN